MFWQAFGQLNQVPGLKAFPVLDAALPTAGNFSVELVVKSTDDYAQMKAYAEKMVTNFLLSIIALYEGGESTWDGLKRDTVRAVLL